MATRHDLLAVLARIVGAGHVLADPAELLTYARDAGLDSRAPDLVVLPGTADETAAVVAEAAGAGLAVVPRGAGTGLAGGAVAEHGGLVLSLARMDGIEIDPLACRAIVGPGAVNEDLAAQARAYGLSYPPDPSSGRTATIGGNLATNAGGPHCFKHGVTTNYVASLEVALADGRRVWLGGRATDAPEYDLAALVAGSEGTLGVITAAALRLVRAAPAVRTMMAAFDSLEQAASAVSAVIAAGLVPATLEMMDPRMMRIVEDFVPAGLPVDRAAALIVEVDGYEGSVDRQLDEVAALLREHGADDLRLARTGEERDRLWYGRKSAAGAVSRLAPAYYTDDVTVPRSHLADMLAEVNAICDRLQLAVGYVFHAGDGNLHPLILFDPRDASMVSRVLAAGRDIVAAAVARDGSLTGEHGVGIEKREFMTLMYSPAELSAMQDVKHVFDPQGVLNPGKVLPATIGTPRRVSPSDAVSDVFTPASADEAASNLAALSAAGGAVYVGGPPPRKRSPGSTWLSTGALAGAVAFAPDDLFVRVGAGMTLASLQASLAASRMQVPMASPWTHATVGGLLAGNVNAPLRLRYSGLRDQVLAVTVALADGRVLHLGRPVVKNVAGYDLPKVFVGSHGTLGLIADVTLRVVPIPRAGRSVVVGADAVTEAVRWARHLPRLALVASGVVIADAEVIATLPPDRGRYLLVYTAEGLDADVDAELAEVMIALEKAGAPHATVLPDVAATGAWSAFLGGGLPGDILVRSGVPVNALESFVAVCTAPGALPGLIDAAAGLVYTRLPAGAPAVVANQIRTLRERSVAAGGYTVVMEGEGAGLAGVDRWGAAPASRPLMASLKARWDPARVLDPGGFVG